MQKHLQVNDLSMGEYVTDKCALWLDFRMINEELLHRTGRVIGSARGRSTLQIEKKAETSGKLKAHIYLIMDAQLNIQNGAFVSAVTRKMAMLCMMKPHKALFLAQTGVRKTHLALDLLKREYLDHFDFIIILCPILRHNKT